MFNGMRLLDCTVPFKRIDVQEHFAAIVALYERLRAQAREAKRQGEGLFQSLLSESFAEGLSESFHN